jgi:HD domain
LQRPENPFEISDQCRDRFTPLPVGLGRFKDVEVLLAEPRSELAKRPLNLGIVHRLAFLCPHPPGFGRPRKMECGIRFMDGKGKMRLPPEVEKLLEEIHAPPRLVAHLEIVHEVAGELTALLMARWPTLSFDRNAVLFGAAIHDLGKALHPAELFGPGRRHEVDGPALLERHGIPPELARFARTHGERHPDLALEDLLVALADVVWKGKREENLESLVTARIAALVHLHQWEVFSVLDEMLSKIAANGERRLAMQMARDK